MSELHPSTPIGAYFDAIAPGYDERTAGAGLLTHKRTAIMLGEISIQICPEYAADLGAGTGSSVQTILSEFPQIQRVDAVDASSEMLHILGTKLKDPRVRPVHKTVAAYLNEVSADSLDLVTSISVLPFIEDADATLRGIRAALRDNGRTLFTYELREESEPGSVSYHHAPTDGRATIYRRTPLEMEKLTEAAGLAIVHAEQYEVKPGSDQYSGLMVARAA